MIPERGPPLSSHDRKELARNGSVAGRLRQLLDETEEEGGFEYITASTNGGEHIGTYMALSEMPALRVRETDVTAWSEYWVFYTHFSTSYGFPHLAKVPRDPPTTQWGDSDGA